MLPRDTIRIEELQVLARVGVGEEERATPQRLAVSIDLQPRHAFSELEDDLSRTVDYAAVCETVQKFIAAREDRLIETLADALAAHLLVGFPIAHLELEVRKFILPQTKYVAVRIARDGR